MNEEGARWLSAVLGANRQALERGPTSGKVPAREGDDEDLVSGGTPPGLSEERLAEIRAGIPDLEKMEAALRKIADAAERQAKEVQASAEKAATAAKEALEERQSAGAKVADLGRQLARVRDQAGTGQKALDEEAAKLPNLEETARQSEAAAGQAAQQVEATKEEQGRLEAQRKEAEEQVSDAAAAMGEAASEIEGRQRDADRARQAKEEAERHAAQLQKDVADLEARLTTATAEERPALEAELSLLRESAAAASAGAAQHAKTAQSADQALKSSQQAFNKLEEKHGQFKKKLEQTLKALAQAEVRLREEREEGKRLDAAARDAGETLASVGKRVRDLRTRQERLNEAVSEQEYALAKAKDDAQKVQEESERLKRAADLAVERADEAKIEAAKRRYEQQKASLTLIDDRRLTARTDEERAAAMSENQTLLDEIQRTLDMLAPLVEKELAVPGSSNTRGKESGHRRAPSYGRQLFPGGPEAQPGNGQDDTIQPAPLPREEETMGRVIEQFAVDDAGAAEIVPVPDRTMRGRIAANDFQSAFAGWSVNFGNIKLRDFVVAYGMATIREFLTKIYSDHFKNHSPEAKTGETFAMLGALVIIQAIKIYGLVKDNKEKKDKPTPYQYTAMALNTATLAAAAGATAAVGEFNEQAPALVRSLITGSRDFVNMFVPLNVNRAATAGANQEAFAFDSAFYASYTTPISWALSAGNLMSGAGASALGLSNAEAMRKLQPYLLSYAATESFEQLTSRGANALFDKIGNGQVPPLDGDEEARQGFAGLKAMRTSLGLNMPDWRTLRTTLTDAAGARIYFVANFLMLANAVTKATSENERSIAISTVTNWIFSFVLYFPFVWLSDYKARVTTDIERASPSVQPSGDTPAGRVSPIPSSSPAAGSQAPASVHSHHSHQSSQRSSRRSAATEGERPKP